MTSSHEVDYWDAVHPFIRKSRVQGMKGSWLRETACSVVVRIRLMKSQSMSKPRLYTIQPSMRASDRRRLIFCERQQLTARNFTALYASCLADLRGAEDCGVTFVLLEFHARGNEG